MTSIQAYNDYTFLCKPLDSTVGYKQCLHILEVADADGLADSFADCNSCIGNKTCEAVRMRAREVKARAPLYYHESPLKKQHEREASGAPETVSTREKTSDSYKRGYACLDKKKTLPVQSKKPAKKVKAPAPAVIENPYQALVEEVMKSEAAEAQSTNKPRPGESFVNYVARLKKEKEA